MATTLHEPTEVDPRRVPGNGNGGGGWVPGDGGLGVSLEYSPPASATAIWVVLFAITMMFAAFTSALIVRKGSSLDWRGFQLPPVLVFNTLLLLASSVTLELSRRRIAARRGQPSGEGQSPAGWLYLTLVFGLLFVAGQYLAWSQLRAQGLYLATNPSSSFFYVLTATHALHVLGGLAGLGYVIRKLRNCSLRRSTLDATARYWHFMDLLWLYLLLLLWMKI